MTKAGTYLKQTLIRRLAAIFLSNISVPPVGVRPKLPQILPPVFPGASACIVDYESLPCLVLSVHIDCRLSRRVEMNYMGTKFRPSSHKDIFARDVRELLGAWKAIYLYCQELARHMFPHCSLAVTMSLNVGIGEISAPARWLLWSILSRPGFKNIL